MTVRVHILGRKAYQLGYGTDEQGRAWATFNGPPVPCAICGKVIARGWVLSPRDTCGDAAQHMCSEHVERVEAPA